MLMLIFTFWTYTAPFMHMEYQSIWLRCCPHLKESLKLGAAKVKTFTSGKGLNKHEVLSIGRGKTQVFYAEMLDDCHGFDMFDSLHHHEVACNTSNTDVSAH